MPPLTRGRAEGKLEKETRQHNWEEIGQKLVNSGDEPRYFRSFDEIAETEEHTRWLEDEFPERESLTQVDRRNFLKVMGASIALAGLAGCRSLPHGKLVPHVKEPEERIPGLAYYYASSMPFAGYGFPVLVESHEGRPTKLEGNPEHPWSMGRSDAFVQAEILNMYDPDRAQNPKLNGIIATWEEFFRQLRGALTANKGQGVAVLTERVTSPTTQRLLNEMVAKYPATQWFQYETVNNDSEMAGTMAAFGKYMVPVYDLKKAKTVVSLDGDFLGGSPHHVRYAADFTSNRNPDAPMNRLYAVESAPSLTGAYADHRATCKPSEVEAVAAAIARRVGVAVSASLPLPKAVTEKWLDVVAKDLMSGDGVVIPGDHQTPFVHAMAHAINAKINGAVSYVAPTEAKPTAKVASLGLLTNAINSGAVEHLIVLGGNPVYGAPGDLKFGEAMLKLKGVSVYLGTQENETAELCKWSLPESHFLESWGDQRSPDGTISLQQPLIEPLFDTKSQNELISGLTTAVKPSEELVKATWPQLAANKKGWEKALADGWVANTGSPKAMPAVQAMSISPSAKGGEIEAVFVPDPTVYDGRYSNNGWLQELPKPLTKLTWDNAVLMGPRLAQKLGVGDESKVLVKVGDREVVAGVMVQPGHADDVVTLSLGYGRMGKGRVQKGAGFNFAQLRESVNPGFAVVSIARAPGTHRLVTAQSHHSMEGRAPIREGTLADYQGDPELLQGKHEHGVYTFYNLTKQWADENPEYPQWGMTIDLNLCTGCNACVTACQAENNISTVGKDEVGRGRELHWIRVDRYYRVTEGPKHRDLITGAAQPGTIEAPIHTPLSGPIKDEEALDPNRVVTVFQPIPCMHCETAPCEPVCPVAATVHSHEGLNQMVYNRCVGTRYCSNNCPYKVRRFNYYNYQHGQQDQLSFTKTPDGKYKLGKDYGQRNFQGEADKPLLRLIHNPDVSVRSRGVMEKCTYCVQRINEARIKAKKERRPIADGEIVTACQQACPTRAIEFGNISDPKSKVSQMKAKERNYDLLAEIGTAPRTSYLGRVRNTHPELEKA